MKSTAYIDENVILELCGTASDKYIDYLRRKLQKYSPNSTINYRGQLNPSELVQYYSSCDIFFFCSHSEGLGKSLLEAMSCKCPPICSDIDTFREVIINEYNGLIVSPRKPKQIGEAIKIYLKNFELKRKISENCRKTIEAKYSKESEICKWIDIIEFETTIKNQES